MKGDPLQPFHEAASILGLDDALNGFLQYEFNASARNNWLKWWLSMGGGRIDRNDDPQKKPGGFSKVLNNLRNHRLYSAITPDVEEFLGKLYFFLFGGSPPIQSLDASKKR